MVQRSGSVVNRERRRRRVRQNRARRAEALKRGELPSRRRDDPAQAAAVGVGDVDEADKDGEEGAG